MSTEITPVQAALTAWSAYWDRDEGGTAEEGMTQALAAAEEVRLAKVRAQNTKAFEDFARPVPELTPWQQRLTEHFLTGGTVEMRYSLHGGAYWYMKPAPEEETE